MTHRKKLIEVALPLEAINRESAREKSIRHGHPSTLHLWWSRKPLATCRAVIFASLIDDPGQEDLPPQLLAEIDCLPSPEVAGFFDLPNEEQRRQRLFHFMERLVAWESTSDAEVMSTARDLVLAATGDEPPPLLDPFAGGGSIPLEGQRLGLEAHAGELNPVAALISKALIEIPPKFAGMPPVNPESRENADLSVWRGAQGLAEDVRHYGAWMREQAEKRIGGLYLRGPEGETVIAWLWARTVRCPNPACGASMPLASKFWLSKKKGKKAWVGPVVEDGEVRFEVKEGEGEPPVDGTVNRQGARCLVCESAVPFNHVRAEGQAGSMGQRLMAVVAEGERGRKYLPPTDEHVEAAEKAQPQDVPETDLPEKALGFRVQQYGMTKHADLFTRRQLVALTTFSDLVSEARERARLDALEAGMGEGEPLSEGGDGATAYADAVATYLAFAVDRLVDRSSTICGWDTGYTKVRNTFSRQAIPMVWDFAEANPLSDSTGNFSGAVDWVSEVIEKSPASAAGIAKQLDATDSIDGVSSPLISTDPPYYDNVPYSDLSDFFYVWLRRSLKDVHPDLFSTLLTPKSAELIADQYRRGGKEQAREFFESGLSEAFARMRKTASPDYPLTVYYAFKQAEASADGEGAMVVASTGWETMLEGLIGSGFQITGTWPMRTEMGTRMRNMGSNALASSIVLCCRPREANAPPATRREFQAALRRELPGAISVMMGENIAPVDLAQATIGPGMAIYSRYSGVLEADGSPLPVRAALQMINTTLDEILAEQEGDLDPDSRFCLAWFDQRAHSEGPFGEADVLARARNTSVEGLERAGVISSRGGQVRLLKREELPAGWDPSSDQRIPVWEATQHLVAAVMEGEKEAARIARSLGSEKAEAARALSYRLYQLCERKGRAEDALAYNTLVKVWPEVSQLAAHEENETLF